MSTFDIYDYEYTDISEAVEAVTGTTVVYTSIDDEHAFWFVVEDENESITYDNPNAEFLDELYSEEDLDKVQAYLEANYEK
jgi:hypothetical protein